MQDLRKYVGKKLVSFLRQGDFSHPGETEAIDITLDELYITPSDYVLDVGCGLGGTVSYIHEKYNCHVVGLDVEPEAISHANEKYKNGCTFYTADVIYSHKILKERYFSVICAFNSFFAFPNQAKALQSLAKIANNKTTLTIFEYSDLTESKDTNPLCRPDSGISAPFMPIDPKNVDKLLLNNGWSLDKLIDISDKYTQWYKQLIEKLKKNKEYIFTEYGKNVYEKAETTYSSIYDSLLEKTSGGIIVYAKKV